MALGGPDFRIPAIAALVGHHERQHARRIGSDCKADHVHHQFAVFFPNPRDSSGP